MWDIQSTTRLLQQMSRSIDTRELVRLFFHHVERVMGVQRALVLSNAGLSSQQFRVVQNVSHDEATSPGELRTGGLLAKLVYLGEFQHINRFEPDPSDPCFDLLGGARSLLAFPLFDPGTGAELAVMLCSSSQPHNAADLCTLATMTSLLGRAIQAQKLANELQSACRALDSELQAAANVQRWLLPSLPALDDVDVAASYRTARYSGGDYYDVGRLSDGRLGILIADVSGKGAAAAVLMAVLRSIVHDEVDRTAMTSPAALLDHADRRLRAMKLSQHGAFVTAFCCVLDPTTGNLTYSNAGHNPPRLLRARERTVVALSGASTIPLGLEDEADAHVEETIQLAPRDLTLLYSDGITEARSPPGEFFGVECLDRLLVNLPEPIIPQKAVELIAKAVADFSQCATPADDQTLVALGGACL